MRSYPTKGVWKLDETDGVLQYRGRPIGAIADLRIPRGYDPENPWHPLGSRHFEAARVLLRQEGIANPLLYAIYRCKNCRSWAIGNGSITCSAECRRAYRARAAREPRAKVRGTTTRTTCVVCGGPLGAQRASRRYCSNRCRQTDYRNRQWAKSA